MTDDPEVLSLLVQYAGIKADLFPSEQAKSLDKLYAILKASENNQPVERVFRRIATIRYLWNVSQFENWAQGKTWAT